MRVRLVRCLILAFVVGCAEGNQMQVRSQVQSRVDALVAELARGEIGKVEVLQIPPRILTRTRITPEMLEKQFHYKLTIRDLRGGAYQAQILNVAKTIAAQPRTEAADLRWGVLFYNLDGARVGALYFDKTGRHGAVGDAPVSFGGEFFKWVEESFARCFR